MIEDLRPDKRTARPLTRNQMLVYTALKAYGGTMSAYAILDELRPEGLRAPLQVYRALDKLCANGLVHRIESQNAFVLRQHPKPDGNAQPVFLLCKECKAVRETMDEAVADALSDLVERENFTPTRTILEIEGGCHGGCGKRGDGLKVV